MKDKTSVWSQKANGSPTSRDPLNIIGYERGDQRRLCETLESIADKLGETAEEPICRDAYAVLKDRLPVYHRNEEALFGLLAQHEPNLFPVAEIVEKIKSEHCAYESYADELDEFMESHRTGRDLGVYGYMFRCFFETIRCHLDWEELTLMPSARHYLDSSDLDQLVEIVAENRRSIGLSVV